MTGTATGVSGVVEYDADVYCFNKDAHDDGEMMHPSDETSDKGNTIYECPECGVRRAVKLHVARLGKTEG